MRAATIVRGLARGPRTSHHIETGRRIGRLRQTLNATVTTRLLDAGHLDPRGRIEIGGLVLNRGQPVVTRANDRRLTYGLDAREWVRNGDRWTTDSGTRDELYLTNADNGHRIALPADYIAERNLAVDYASTINRAQGTTVEEAHVIINERTNAKQLYVAMTRGRNANHVHTASPAFDPDQHGPPDSTDAWTPTRAVTRSLQRQPDTMSAIARRRQLRATALEKPRSIDPAAHISRARSG